MMKKIPANELTTETDHCIVRYLSEDDYDAFLEGYRNCKESQNRFDDGRIDVEGLYGIVRHPMYFATLLMFLPLPLILQSFWGLIPVALYPVLIVVRIVNEEKVLSAGLEGYEEYKKKVKYRILPFIW